MTNICINCIHHHNLAGSPDHFCRHPNYMSEPNLVTGSQWPVKCDGMRRGDCGKEGKFFQQKPIQLANPDIKPISNDQLHRLLTRDQ